MKKDIERTVVLVRTTSDSVFLVFDVVTGNFLLVNRRAADLLRTNDIQSLYRENICLYNKMLSIGMLCEVPNEGSRALNRLRNIQTRRASYNIALILTNECDFACTYCYENSVLRRCKRSDAKHHHEMPTNSIFNSDEGVVALIDWMERELICDGDSDRPLNVHWCGGEPLLMSDRIPAIGKAIRDRFGVSRKVTFAISTNGWSLSRDMAERLKEVGPTIAQVTLDGPPEVHNGKRQRADGLPSYDRILKNIEDTADVLSILMRYNWEPADGYDAIVQFYNRAATVAQRRGHRVMPYVAPVMPNANDSGVMSRLGRMDEGAIERAGRVRQFVAEDTRARMRYGFPVGVPNYDVFRCTANSDTAITVGADGRLYHCVCLVEWADACVGDIWRGYNGSHRIFRDELPIAKQCLVCPFLERCGGGCRYSAAVVRQNAGAQDCIYWKATAVLEGWCGVALGAEIAVFSVRSS